MKPLIGISAGMYRDQGRDWAYNTNDYFRAVKAAGGIPVLLPFVETDEEAAEVLNRIDGLLLSGGADMDPQLYGENPHPRNGEVSPERDVAELAYARIALLRDMPILGICRGHQVLAVAGGGTLWQDIPAQVPTALKHAQQGPRWFTSHSVTMTPGSRLASLIGSERKVNTFHHQAVKTIPAGFVSAAEAPDGINEALEHQGHKFVLSVQWHPENFVNRDYNFLPLWEAFITASSNR